MSIWLRTSASSLRLNSSRCFVGHPRRCGSNTALSISQDRAPCGSSTLICGNPQVLGRNAEGCGSGNRLALQRTAWLSHPRSQRTSEGCRLSTSGPMYGTPVLPQYVRSPTLASVGLLLFRGSDWARPRTSSVDARRGVRRGPPTRDVDAFPYRGSRSKLREESRRRRRSTSRRSSRRSGCTADR